MIPSRHRILLGRHIQSVADLIAELSRQADPERAASEAHPAMRARFGAMLETVHLLRAHPNDLAAVIRRLKARERQAHAAERPECTWAYASCAWTVARVSPDEQHLGLALEEVPDDDA